MRSNEYLESAKRFLYKTHTEITVTFLRHGQYFPDDKETRNIYQITLANGKGKWTFTFGQSIHGSKQGFAPNAYDVLACLTKSDPGTFENFCSDYGYGTDSRNAHKIWRAVTKEWKSIKKLFTDKEIEELQEIY